MAQWRFRPGRRPGGSERARRVFSARAGDAESAVRPLPSRPARPRGRIWCDRCGPWPSLRELDAEEGRGRGAALKGIRLRAVHVDRSTRYMARLRGPADDVAASDPGQHNGTGHLPTEWEAPKKDLDDV